MFLGQMETQIARLLAKRSPAYPGLRIRFVPLVDCAVRRRTALAYPYHQFTACNFRTLGAVRWAMLSTTPPSSFRAHYQALVASGAIEADPAQALAADAFADLEQRLTGYKPVRKLGLLGR